MSFFQKAFVLMAIPIAWTTVYLIFSLMFFSQPGLVVFINRMQSPISEMLWLTGCLVAVSRFGPGEYLRKAWMYFAVAPVAFLISDLLPFFTYLQPSWKDGVGLVQGLLAVSANLCGVVATVMFSQAWRVAGLILPGTKMIQWIIRILVAVLAFTATAPGLVANFNRVLIGEDLANSLLAVASALGDTICLVLVAPLILTAIALRGGLLSRPWLFFSISFAGWFIFDFSLTLGPMFDWSPEVVTIIFGVAQSLGSGFSFSAGMAQSLVADRIKSVSRGS